MSPVVTSQDYAILLSRKDAEGNILYLYPIVRDIDILLSDDANGDNLYELLQTGVKPSMGSLSEMLVESTDMGFSFDEENEKVQVTHKNSISSGSTSGTNGSVSYGGTIKIPSFTYDKNGHLTQVGYTSVVLPDGYSLPEASESVMGGIKVGNGFSVTDGVANINEASDTVKGITYLDNDYKSASTTKAATVKAVNDAMDSAIAHADEILKNINMEGVKPAYSEIKTMFVSNGDIRFIFDEEKQVITAEHYNDITSAYTTGSSGKVAHGETIRIPKIGYDKLGHIKESSYSEITLPDGYVLPIGGADKLGGYKVGVGLNVNADTGVLNAVTGTVHNAGIVQLITSTDSDDETMAATPKSVSQAKLEAVQTAQGHIKSAVENFEKNGVKPNFEELALMFESTDDVEVIKDYENTDISFTHTNVIEAGTASGSESATLVNGGNFNIPVITFDKNGHVTGTSTTTMTLPEFSANKGITLEGNTISHTNAVVAGTASGTETSTLDNGGAFNMPTVTYDAQGHVTGKGTTKITLPTFAAGSGIALDGLTFKHTNAITAGSISGTSTTTISNGASFSIPNVTYDAQGHITKTGTTTITLPKFTANNGITLSGNNFSHSNSIEAGTASGSESATLVNGGGFDIPTVTYDDQGHITEVGVTSMVLPKFAAGSGITLDGLTFKHTNSVTAGTASGTETSTLGNGGSVVIPTVTYDAQGHVTSKGSTTVTLPTFTAGNGIKLDGLSFKHINSVTAGTVTGTATSTLTNGGNFSIPNVTYDAQGHITKTGTTTITLPKFTANNGITLSGNNFGHTNVIESGIASGSENATLGNGGGFDIPTVSFDVHGHITEVGVTSMVLPKFAAGSGITLDGLTFKHTNSVTAGTASGTSTTTLANGGSFNMPTVTYDAYGHVTEKGTTKITLPTFSAEAGISLTGNKFAHTNSIEAGSISGTATSTLSNGGSFVIPNVTYDAQGHITEVGTTTITLPKITAGTGISVSGSTITNSGVRGISTGSKNGTISVNTNGSSADIAVKGLGSAAYTESSAYSPYNHTHKYAASSSVGGSATNVAGTVTNPSTATMYYLPFHSSATTGAKSILNNDGIGYYTLEGTTSAAGIGEIVLGNATASGTAANKTGRMRLYGSNTGYTTLVPGYNNTGNITLTLPSSSGTIALTGGNVNSATNATNDSDGQKITSTYIKSLSVSGRTITFTRGDDSTGTITTQDNNTTYSAGTGLSLSGTKFNHTNSVEAGTAKGSDTKTLTFGGTFTIPTVTYDAQGHITEVGTTTMTMPSNPNSDTKVTNTLNTTTKFYLTGTTSATTSTGTQIFDTGVYVDTTAGKLVAASFAGSGASLTSLNASNISSGTLSADRLASSGATAGSYGPSANATLAHKGTFTVPYVTVDAKGRVTAISNITYTLPSDSNTDTKVTQTVTETNAEYPILASTTASASATATTTTRFATGITINPSTNTITASAFAGSGASLTSLNASNIGSGTLAKERLATSGATAGSYGPSANATLAHSGTFTVPYVTVDTYGRVTGIKNITYTLPGSGNTDTKVKITANAPTEQTSYYPTMYTATSGTTSVTANTNVKYSILTGTASAVGNAYLILGNTTASGTAGNSQGILRIYSANTGYHTIQGASTTGTPTHTLPTTGGTVLNTGTTSVTQVLTSGTHAATIKINGTETKIYAPTNTDTHYTSHLYVGASGGNANATSATSNPYLLMVDNTTNRNSIQLKAGSNMSISAINGVVTFTATDTNTTYSAGTGISLSGTTFSNSGVRSIATGSSNGTISVNTGGTTANVAVKGLGSAAYTASTAYANATHSTISDTQPSNPSKGRHMWYNVLSTEE